MKRTWMPRVAGTLNIVSGVIGLVVVFGLSLAIIVVGDTRHWVGVDYWSPINVVALLWIIMIPFVICSILALVGGIYALERKMWGLALAGSIAAFFPQCLFGLTSIVLTALSKDEFEPVHRQTLVESGKTG